MKMRLWRGTGGVKIFKEIQEFRIVKTDRTFMPSFPILLILSIPIVREGRMGQSYRKKTGSVFTIFLLRNTNSKTPRELQGRGRKSRDKLKSD